MSRTCSGPLGSQDRLVLVSGSSLILKIDLFEFDSEDRLALVSGSSLLLNSTCFSSRVAFILKIYLL